MKKIIYVLGIVILVILATIFYMNTSSINEEREVIIDINKLAEDIKNQKVFDDTLEIIEKDIAITNYNFNNEIIQDLVSYVSTGATAEEILVIEAKDKNSIKAIEEKITERIKERKEAFASYLPNEVYKLENPVLIIKDKYIILCIWNNSQNMSEYIEKYLKTV